jgi:hypothetical protein
MRVPGSQRKLLETSIPSRHVVTAAKAAIGRHSLRLTDARPSIPIYFLCNIFTVFSPLAIADRVVLSMTVESHDKGHSHMTRLSSSMEKLAYVSALLLYFLLE